MFISIYTHHTICLNLAQTKSRKEALLKCFSTLLYFYAHFPPTKEVHWYFSDLVFGKATSYSPSNSWEVVRPPISASPCTCFSTCWWCCCCYFYKICCYWCFYYSSVSSVLTSLLTSSTYIITYTMLIVYWILTPLL